MKPPAALPSLASSIILVSLGISVSACRERSNSAETPEPETTAAPVPYVEPISTHEQITQLRREIQQREQNIQGLEAAVQMERAKLDDDPNYDQSFLREVLEEQQQDRLEIEAAQSHLDQLTMPGQ